MNWLGSIEAKLVAGVVILLSVGGAYEIGHAIGHNAGVTQERNAQIAAQAKAAEAARKEREKFDEKVRNLPDDAALKCLRNPSGC